MNALVCGLVCALSFIGFVSCVHFLLLWIYRPKGNSRYIVKFPTDVKRGRIESLVYGTYFKKLIFGDLIFDEIEFDSSALSEEEKHIADVIIDEMKIYINAKNNCKDNCEEKDERKP